MPSVKHGVALAGMNDCRRRHRDPRMTMLMIIPFEEAAKECFRILCGAETFWKVSMILERFEGRL